MHKLSVGKSLKIVTLLLYIILVYSCLTVDSVMELNENGSGSITINYNIDKGLSGISKLGDDSDIVPLNLSEENIIQMIGSRDDIEYNNFYTDENDNNYIVNVTFQFDSIEALNSVLPIDNKIYLVREGSTTVFRQGIVPETDEDINDVSLEILKDIYKNHTFSLEVNVPNDIISVENGDQIDQRTAIYSENLIDVITSKEKKEWVIRW